MKSLLREPLVGFALAAGLVFLEGTILVQSEEGLVTVLDADSLDVVTEE